MKPAPLWNSGGKALPAILSSRLVLCLGPGGVGKTTIAAALSVGGALEGMAVDVMTVDPAPRLLDALGLDAESAEPREVSLDGLRHRPAGRMRALKLDPKRTFDGLVGRYAPSAAVGERILSNRLYRNISQALAGVADYMAIEKLLELHGDETVELLVLDTPPAREALDFLEAPKRLLDLLNSRAAALLGASQGFFGQSLKWTDWAARAVLAAFDRLTGLRLLGDVQAFVESFAGMYGGFAERAKRAEALLRGKDSLVVVVTTAEALRVDEALDFVDSLARAGIAVGALIVNRVLPEMPNLTELRKAKMDPRLKRKIRLNWDQFEALHRREKLSVKALHQRLPRKTRIAMVPDLGREPRSLEDLVEIAQSLRLSEA